MNDEQRTALHVAAVFTNNFTNHMVAIAQDICEKEKINFKLLQPLLIETFEKLKTQRAKDVQTGPARRKDKVTIARHLEYVKRMQKEAIYSNVTGSILDFYKSL
jgi:predicted short-subunit dehydrogenase-like oxidoreductase (DUF2520 family)